jgi:hypothetical protein
MIDFSFEKLKIFPFNPIYLPSNTTRETETVETGEFKECYIFINYKPVDKKT